MLDFYYRRSISDKFRSKNHRLMVYHEMGLYPWHLNSQVVPGEKLKPNQKNRVGYFLFHENKWKLKNENIPGLAEYTNDGSPPKKQGIGTVVELTQGQKLILDPGNNGQLVHVTLVNV